MLGLVFFVPMIALCLPVAWRSADRRIHLARLVLSITGVGMILYLIIAELFIIKAICLWCSSVHLITFILFVIIVTASPIVLAPGLRRGRPMTGTTSPTTGDVVASGADGHVTDPRSGRTRQPGPADEHGGPSGRPEPDRRAARSASTAPPGSPGARWWSSWSASSLWWSTP